MISDTGTPASPSFSTATICDSVNRDFFIGNASSSGTPKVYLSTVYPIGELTVRLVRGRDRQTLELRPPGTSAHPGISVTHVPGILCYLCPRLLTLPRNIRPHGRIPARKRVACEADCRSGQRAAGSGQRAAGI